MRNLLTIAALTLVSFGFAGAAQADTSTYNRYTNTHQYDGYTETTVDAHVSSATKEITNSTSTKVEAIADLGDVNVTNVSYKNGEFSANASSRNGRPVDPISTIYVSETSQRTVSFTNETADIDTFSSNRFSGNVREHEVGTRN